MTRPLRRGLVVLAVLGALARSMGRLRLEVDERTGVARALVALSRGPEGDAPPYQMEGVALGMASFVQRLRGAPRPAFFQARLKEMTRYGIRAPAGDVGAVRIRELAVEAYGSEGLTAEELGAFLSDPAAEVRWAAAVRLASIPDPFRSSLAGLASDDPSPRVRLEAVRRGQGMAPLTPEACTRLLTAAAGDPDIPVRLAALDVLALPCPDRGGQSARLEEITLAAAAAPPSDWHVGGHALAALAGGKRAVDRGRSGHDYRCSRTPVGQARRAAPAADSGEGPAGNTQPVAEGCGLRPRQLVQPGQGDGMGTRERETLHNMF